MTRARIPTASLLALAVLASPAPARAEDWKSIPVPPLHAFQIPQPQRVELANGLVIFLMEDHELPVIELKARIRTGSRLEPADKVGLGEIFGQAWRTGGSKSKNGDALDDMLEARAAKVESNMGAESASLSMNCLKADFPDVLKVFVDVLRNPAFPEDKIELAKKQVTTGIARRNDSPDEILQREATKLGYGPDSPYARVPEYATVAAITKADLEAWHARYVLPNRTFIGVVGDFDSKAMTDTLKKTFGGWPKGPDDKDPEAAYRKEPAPGIYFVQKDDVTQAQVAMVHLGIRRDNPDYFAGQVLNEIFTGGFTSRLMSHVRSDKGLAYNVWGALIADFDHPGLFMVQMGTKNTTVAAGIDALYEEIEGMAGKVPVTEDELRRAKESILNSFVFKFDSKEKVLDQQMTYAYYGYPADFLQRYRAAIEKVTVDDVMRVGKTYIHKDQLAVLVVGKADEFDKPLSSYGQVKTIDITIPMPGTAKKGPASAADSAKGKALMDKVVEGFGGKAKLAAVKDVTYKGSVVMKTPQGDMSMKMAIYVAGDDRMRQDMETPMGAMSMVVGPSAAFMAMGGQTQDMPGSQKKEMMEDARRDILFLARHADDPKLTVAHGGQEKVGEVEAEILDLSYDGADVRLWVDPATGRVLRKSYQGVGPQGPMTSVSELSDYRQVDGMWFPHAESIAQNGEPAQSIKVDEVKINSGVDPKMFEK